MPLFFLHVSCFSLGTGSNKLINFKLRMTIEKEDKMILVLVLRLP